jgi:hypothetical protein
MRDHRRSSPRSTPTSGLRCELILESTVLPAMLLNESENGFGVLVSGTSFISAHRKAQLLNCHRLFDCEVVYAMEVVPATRAIYTAAGVKEPFHDFGEHGGGGGAKHVTAEDIDQFTASTKGPWLRLGIRCLHEVRSSAASAAAIPVQNGGPGLLQSIAGLCASLFGR